MRLYNIDDFGDLDTARQTPPEVEAILQAQMENFTRGSATGTACPVCRA